MSKRSRRTKRQLKKFAQKMSAPHLMTARKVVSSPNVRGAVRSLVAALIINEKETS